MNRKKLNQNFDNVRDIDEFCLTDNEDFAALASRLSKDTMQLHKKVDFFLPDPWLRHPRLPSIRTFYEGLLARLEEINFSPNKLIQTSRIIPSNQDNIASISYHTHLKARNSWNIKISYIPDYFSFDRSGYSGWSEMAASARLQALAQNVNQSIADTFLKTLINKLKEGNASKFPQLPRNPDLIKHRKDYIFVPLQLEDDSVLVHTERGISGLIEAAVQIAQRTGLRVVFKRHPLCKSENVSGTLQKLIDDDQIFEIGASIHDLIEGSRAVLVLNSGVGFEALLHQKPVISMGYSEYAHVTFFSRKIDEICEELMNQDQDAIVRQNKSAKFLYFFLNKYLINIYNEDSYWRHIVRMLLHLQIRY